MSKNYNFEGKRVLIVEDIEMMREVEAKRLSMIGFDVDLAVNGKEAVELYLSHSNWYYQAILMDIIMPVMDGREAAKIIRSSKREDSLCIPIISISSDNSPEAIEASLSVGIDQFLEKPIDFILLFENLEKAIQNTTIITSRLFINTMQNDVSSKYSKLWKMLIDKKMTKTDLRKLINCSTVTLAKLGKGEKVSIVVLNKICKALNCNFEDIIDEY